MNPKFSLVIGILCISFAPIFVRFADAPPVTAAFYRMLIALVCLAPYCFIKRNLKIDRKTFIIAIAGGILFGADIAVWNISLTITSATISSLIANITPVWVGLLSLIFLKKRSGKLFWAGTCIAIIGIIILAGYKTVFSINANLGLWLALLSSLLYAIYILLTKSILDQVETLTLVFYNLAGATVFLGLICMFQQGNMLVFSGNTWLCFAGLGLICQLTGWLTITHSLRFLPSTKVSLALLARAVIAGFWAFLLLNERLGLSEIVGSVIVLAGIALTFLKPKQSNKILN
ncbi:DMT family transporter [Mucilaginibacter gotjawali]|uniref:Drug/metabolite transporter (DMT)-like permease n=1 Tax=Mucilaginibacter gotjawali TaxID=1550579 RepID=A0A839SCE5_9SPHI|nr:DMT family transporter [Mucilaginibacter gotjawali]MBB3054580.1 drug/metabolite transporter (DMT)-like permease [Mucilaginibacter gotjawali]